MKLKDRCLTNKPAVEEPDRAVDLHRRTVHPEDACVHPEELVSLIVRKATEKERDVLERLKLPYGLTYLVLLAAHDNCL